jgi:hypothetical protein
LIAKPFIMAKDKYPISATILPDNKIIRDHGSFLAARVAEAARVADLLVSPEASRLSSDFGLTVARLELLDLAPNGPGEIDAEGVRKKSDAHHDVREFPAESVPAVPARLLPALVLERAENLRLELAHFLAELDRLGEREGGVATPGGRIEAEARGQAACLALSKLREVAEAHVGWRRCFRHAHNAIPG